MTAEQIIAQIAKELGTAVAGTAAVIMLLREGATVPFIARYRKEKTGNMDELAVRAIEERLAYYDELEDRREYIRGVIESQGKLTEELAARIASCVDAAALEDIYLPYKPKRKTRAQAAREKGLEPLADMILHALPGADRAALIKPFVNIELGVADQDAALAGAMDIIAERIAEKESERAGLRAALENQAVAAVRVRKEYKEKRTKFEQYYNYTAPLAAEPSHRILAFRRGVEEGVLSLAVENPADQEYKASLKRRNIPVKHPFTSELSACMDDAYERLLYPSVSNDVWSAALAKAERDAISLFARNLENLLLSPPAGRRVILGVDPGFRTGCKLAVVGANSDFLGYEVIYPTEPRNETQKSAAVLQRIVEKFAVELVAIGNGTASRETQLFVTETLKGSGIPIVVVSESGASVYSASPLAAKEFPDLDLTVRSAVNIARRLQDPLAELVKIDPCAIGVGQYQHDVNQKQLKRALDSSVVSCVSRVGVELNTASAELLTHVAGLSAALAKKIVKKRSELKGFTSRDQLLNVPGLGDKTFEQCAAFLRIADARNPLDNSAIHPESYGLVERIAADLQLPVASLVANEAAVLKIDRKKYAGAGEYTVQDIIAELAKPGRDPRKEFSYAEFAEGVNAITDLSTGMVLNGVVTNVTGFGAFVDIGVHQDGLIHVSNLADRFVKDPLEIVSPGDAVRVEVLSVDVELKRIGLKRLG